MMFHPRSAVKALMWRFVAGIDTFLLSWLITGKASYAVGIMSTEFFTKSMIYYLHERVWRMPWFLHLFGEDR